jgi:phage gp29-like protein
MPVQNKRIGDQGINEYALNTNRTVEYLTELQGREGSIKYRQMSKGDPIVGMILRVHKNPIRSASWNIPYPSDVSDQEKQAIDIIKNRLFGESGAEFDSLLGKILSMLEYGFSLFERYYEPVDVDGNTYLLPVIEQRMQTSIEDVFPKEKYVRQLSIDNGQVNIPFDSLLFFVLNQQGEDLRGESLMRNAYRAWKAKKVYQEWLGIGIQRSVAGVPSKEVPKGTRTDSADYIAVEQLLQKVCQHETAYMITQEGWKFTINESKFNADPVQKAIDSCNSEMALSVLAQFVMLGQQGNTGAFALSRDQSDFFLDGLQYIVDLICGVINDKVIRPYLEINFGTAIDPSRVVLSGQNLNKKAGLELSNVLTQLKSSGFIKPTIDDEIQLRSNLEMPELTEEQIEERNNEPEPELESPAEPVFKFAETKTKSRVEVLDFEQGQLTDVMRANLLMIKDKLVADIKATLNRGTIEIRGLKNIDVSWSKYASNLERKLAGIAQLGWNKAKLSAKLNSVKLSDSIDISKLTNKELAQYIINHAQTVAEDQVTSMKINAILTASNGPIKGLSVDQTMSNVDKIISDFIEGQKVSTGASLMTVGALNFGEMQFYQEIKEQLWGYRFTNADPISDVCQWYNGKTFSVDSVELTEATPPLHPNCKSYMEPIYKTEEQPVIDDVIPPPSIRKLITVF